MAHCASNRRLIFSRHSSLSNAQQSKYQNHKSYKYVVAAKNQPDNPLAFKHVFFMLFGNWKKNNYPHYSQQIGKHND